MGEYLFKPVSNLTFDTVADENLRMEQSLRACGTSVTTLRIDLSSVVLCDTAGLALLIEAKRLSKQFGKLLEVCDIPQHVRDLAIFCGVDGVFTLSPKN